MFCFPGGDAPQARKARKVIANADRTTAPQRGPAVSRIPERYGVTEALRYLSDLSQSSVRSASRGDSVCAGLFMS
jgi:hypothetical protein